MKRSVLYFFLLFLLLYSCRQKKPAVKEEIPLPRGTKEKIQLSNINNDDNISDTASINRQIRYAIAIYKDGRQDNSKFLLINAVWRSKTIDHTLGIVNGLLTTGAEYDYEGLADSALYYYKAALPYVHKLPRESCVEEAIYTRIGKVYYNLAQFDSALYYVYKGLDKLKQHKIKKYRTGLGYKNAFDVYKTAGAVWTNMDNLKTAMPYLEKAKEMAMLLKDTVMLMEMENIKATVYYKRQLFDSAIRCYQSVLNNKAASLQTQIEANYNLGSMYARKESKYEPNKAIIYFQEALRLYRQEYGAGSPSEMRYLFGLGTAYLNKGAKEENGKYYRKAEQIFLEINKRKSKTVLAENLPNFYSNLAVVYGNQHRYKKAYNQSQLAWKMRDSFYDEEKLEMISKLDVQYRIAEKDKQLAQSRLQVVRQQSKLKEKNLLIGGVAASALFLAAFLFSAYRSNKHKKQVYTKEMLLLQQQQEIKQLQAMMKGEEQERGRLAQELHDGVGGMLAAIKMNVSAVERPENPPATAKGLQEVMDLVENTAGEVRRTAHNLMPDILLKHTLPEALRLYCDSINHGNHLQVDLQFHTPLEGLDKPFELPLYRILQELIQNIVKHAQATHAVIQFRQQDQLLHVTVEDDGTGFDVTQQQEGLGLNNIRSRVQALHGFLSIDSSPGRGTTCYMEFDFQKYNNDLAS